MRIARYFRHTLFCIQKHRYMVTIPNQPTTPTNESSEKSAVIGQNFKPSSQTTPNATNAGEPPDAHSIALEKLSSAKPVQWPNNDGPINTKPLPESQSNPVEGPKVFDFKTYVKMLESEGFTNTQAVGLLSLIEEVVNDSISASTRSTVSRDEQSQLIRDRDDDFGRLRNDIRSLEKKDFTILKNELQRITQEVVRTKDSVREDLNRVHGGARLDINLEKARIKDEIQELETLAAKAEEKIDGQISDLISRINKIKSNTRESLFRFVIGCIGVFVTYKLISGFIVSNKKKKDTTAVGNPPQ